jgi:thiol:disulfide interchange protein DsbD
MTADWCVTCLVNERLALTPQPVRQAFADHHVARLKGDWTARSAEITKFLQENERDGVPLYVLYPPNDRTPAVLPQILTEGIVLNALDHLGS